MSSCLICHGPIDPPQSPRWNTWKRFCSRSCAGKHGAQILAKKFSHADRVRLGKEGAAAKRHAYRQGLIERLAHLDRESAIWHAYKAGRHGLKMERLRQRRRQGETR